MIIEWVGRYVRGIVVGGRLVGSRWVGGHWIYYNPLLDSQSFKIVRKFYLPHPAHLTSRSLLFFINNHCLQEHVIRHLGHPTQL